MVWKLLQVFFIGRDQSRATPERGGLRGPKTDQSMICRHGLHPLPESLAQPVRLGEVEVGLAVELPMFTGQANAQGTH